MTPATEAMLKDRECGERPPLALVEGAETAGTALRILATLPPNQQEVIRLRFQDGLRYREIAAVTQLSLSNVGYLIHTAIKTIRERLCAPAGAGRKSGRSLS